VNLHYKGDVLRRHLAGSDVCLVEETPDILDTGGGLRHALPQLGPDPVWTLNPDAVWQGPNPLRVAAEHWDPDAMDALLVCVEPARALGRVGSGDFRSGPDGRVARGGDAIYGGVQIVRTDRLAEFPDAAFSLNRVWDAMIRIGHWGLVAGFATAYLTEGEPQWLHSYAGYAIAAVVAARIAWGSVGPRHARFSDFVTGPGRVIGYLRGLATGRARRHVGHSPAGGAMTVALLFALALTALSGMATLAVEEGEGPLAGIVNAQSLPATMMMEEDHDREYGEHGESGEAFEELHEIAANATLLLIVLHVAGVIVASLAHRENLVRAMITGRKRAS